MVVKMGLIFQIKGKVSPKPAGTMYYRHGRATISMAKNGYHQFCDYVIVQLKDQDKLINPMGFKRLIPHGLIFDFKVPNLLRLGDMSNMAETLQDCLVKAEIIKNDNPSVVNKLFVNLAVDKRFDYSTNIYVCDSNSEFFDIILRIKNDS